MKLIVQNGVVVGTAEDDYQAGPFDDAACPAPDGFDPIKDLLRYSWSKEAGLQRSVPSLISPMQALLALDAAGLSADYEAWAHDPNRTFAEKAFLTRAVIWKRDNPLLIKAATALNISESQLDQLFVAASEL